MALIALPVYAVFVAGGIQLFRQAIKRLNQVDRSLAGSPEATDETS